MTREELFQYSFVLTIDNNRYKRFVSVFNHYNINASKISRYDGIRSTKNIDKMHACDLSHIEMIRFAKFYDWPFVCIFEDDAYPIASIEEDFDKYILSIPSDADIVVLGWRGLNVIQSVTQVSPFYNRFNIGQEDFLLCGGHSYLIFKNAYDEYLKHAILTYGTADTRLSALNHCKNIYLSNKCLFIQCNVHTDSNGKAEAKYRYLIGNKSDPSDLTTFNSNVNDREMIIDSDVPPYGYEEIGFLHYGSSDNN